MAAKPVAKREPVSQEEKENRFKEVATKRVNKALKALDAVAQIGGSSRYAWTPEQASIITGTLDEAVKTIENALAGRVVDRRFSL